jgi:O-6-methylguanine DNA methyltransferase
MTRQTPEPSGFFQRVWAVVADIPEGTVMTYGQIAECLDNVCSARYVGYAMSSAPPERNLPCHRVVNRLGEMSPGLIFGGVEVQRRLLQSEGVLFTDKGRVDLSASRHRPGTAF